VLGAPTADDEYEFDDEDDSRRFLQPPQSG